MSETPNRERRADNAYRTIQNIGRVIVTLMWGALVGVVVFVLYLLHHSI